MATTTPRCGRWRSAAQDGGDVVFDRLLADAQLGGNLLVEKALADLLEYLDFPRGQRRDEGLRLAAGRKLLELLQTCSATLGRVVRASLMGARPGRCADRFDQLLGGNLLAHVGRSLAFSARKSWLSSGPDVSSITPMLGERCLISGRVRARSPAGRPGRSWRHPAGGCRWRPEHRC